MVTAVRFHLLLLVLLTLAGCSGTGADRPLDPTEERLFKIGNAYLAATTRLKRPPKNADELKPSLEGGADADALRSPRDGQPFVIIWGVDFNRLPPGRDDIYTVAAYEQRGADGKRYVLHFPRGVVLLTDEELRKAAFPPGHKPPP
jgi:hypothetical protein